MVVVYRVVDSSGLKESNISAEFTDFVRSAFDKMGMNMDNIITGQQALEAKLDFANQQLQSNKGDMEQLKKTAYFVSEQLTQAFCETKETTLLMSERTFIVLIDYSKAFDSVSHIQMFNILLRMIEFTLPSGGFDHCIACVRLTTNCGPATNVNTRFIHLLRIQKIIECISIGYRNNHLYHYSTAYIHTQARAGTGPL